MSTESAYQRVLAARSAQLKAAQAAKKADKAYSDAVDNFAREVHEFVEEGKKAADVALCDILEIPVTSAGTLDIDAILSGDSTAP